MNSNNSNEIIEIIETFEPDIEIIDSDEKLVEASVVSEDDLDEISASEEEAYIPVVEYGEWTTPEDFQNYIVASIRNHPPVFDGSLNSVRRAFQYLKNVQAELIEGVEQDAPYADLDEDKLRFLDSVEQGIEEALVQIAQAVDSGLTKKATKSSNFTYFVNPFIFGLARTMINGKVSQGKNIEDLFEKLDKKYKLNDREKLELYYVLNDMGHPIRSSFVDHIDMAEQYFA